MIPEFDTPGHVQMGWESTGLLTDCYDKDGTKTGTGPLNPTLNVRPHRLVSPHHPPCQLLTVAVHASGHVRLPDEVLR